MSYKYYQGEYTPNNTSKYKGKYPIIYRSSWEKSFCIWLDKNPQVSWWASESTVISYRLPNENKPRRYFIDFTVEFMSGKIVLFEIKPEKETKPPKKRQRRTKKYLQESSTYARNISKWKAASKYAQKYNISFQILTEKELKKMGVKII